jgi:dGTPase
MTNYSSILSGNRIRKTSVPDRTILTESESDRGRVIFSPAFRRLQQKAQVFSMEPNAAVRSRLTHSLEVSQVGRYIADEVGLGLKLETAEHGALVNFVETACLMHDIGNPPFGHFGEAAIQSWFQLNGEQSFRAALKAQNPKRRVLKAKIVQGALADFLEFDGNPQGLRIVARLQWNTDEYGLNLTKTTLASFLKYVRASGESKEGLFRKKPGFFTTEADVVAEVWKEFKYRRPKRFPLTYIMEAADDIAYCISDLEDSIEKGIVEAQSAIRMVQQAYNDVKIDRSCPEDAEIQVAFNSVLAGKKDDREYTYIDFRTALNRLIIKYAARRFCNLQSKIFSGKLDTLLPVDEPPGAVLDELKKYCRQHVYRHESVQRLELAGYTAIKGLLDHFAILLRIPAYRFRDALEYKTKDAKGNQILLESKLLKLFPEKYKKVYCHHLARVEALDCSDELEWNARAHLVVDFVSGMTDDFAMTTYRTLAGMRL